MVLDNWSLQLYVSEDGRTWRCLRDTFLAPERDAGLSRGAAINRSEHALTWTGTEYLACRRTLEGWYGMMGTGGGSWYSPYNTKLCFADANWNLTEEYDFGRQVLSAGWWKGTYYAEVSESVGISVAERDGAAGSAIWTSADKVNWTKTELRQIMDSIQALS